MTTQPRESIDSLPAYEMADLNIDSDTPVIQLAQNELALPPSPKAIQAARDAIPGCNRYSDIDHLALRKAIADIHGLDASRILCGAGSLEIMSLIASAYCEPGTSVVVSQYGYKFFQVLCSAAGASVHVAPEPEKRINIEAMCDAVTADTRLMVVVNPGNPTGALLASGELVELRRRLPESVMLIVDGAYAEFVSEDSFDNGFGLVDSGANMIVLRTFSKAYGLAGMRTGWCYGAMDIIQSLLKIRCPNSISSPALAAAEAAVRDTTFVAASCREVIELRRKLTTKLKILGLNVLPSAANFVLFECPEQGPINAASLNLRLRERGFILRPMGSYELPNHLRVTIGSRQEMTRLAEALDEIIHP